MQAPFNILIHDALAYKSFLKNIHENAHLQTSRFSSVPTGRIVVRLQFLEYGQSRNDQESQACQPSASGEEPNHDGNQRCRDEYEKQTNDKNYH
jgi:hypothetical protein